MINQSEYAKRRAYLMKQVGRSGVVILPAAPEVFRNGDATYLYRQNSDFYYLTGFQEPEAVLVLLPEREGGEYILFNRVRDRDREIWDGPRAGQEGAVSQYGANLAYPIGELSELLPELISGRDAIHYPLGLNPAFDKILMQSVNQLRSHIRSGQASPVAFFDIMPTLHEMRLHKSDAEVAVMRQAAQISARAHCRAMKACRPGMYEYELEAELSHEFMRQGARVPAYNSIVGSGRNSCILHYINNDQLIHAGDLVLIDAGAEYQQYAADITRTFPADGTFSAEQRAVYDIVLAAQEAAIAAVKPGAAWTTPQDVVVKIVTQGLLDLGILKGSLDSLIESKAYFPYYMHRSGHWLGLDVHDVGRYRIDDAWRSFTPGMALTVEPGLYLSSDIPGLDPRWHHIGIRIEDDVVVTTSGCDVLTGDVPKSIDAIQALMKG